MFELTNLLAAHLFVGVAFALFMTRFWPELAGMGASHSSRAIWFASAAVVVALVVFWPAVLAVILKRYAADRSKGR